MGAIPVNIYLYPVLWALLMSFLLFGMMWLDKRQAKKKGPRIPEKTLFSIALVGGAPGGWLGMRVFRHKTKHWYFVWGFALLAVVDIAAVIYLLWVVLR